MANKQDLIAATIDFYDGALSAMDDALAGYSDASWFEYMERMAEALLTDVCSIEDIDSSGIDGNDIVHAWIVRNGVEHVD